ncbi:hypothetical protein PT7_P008 (plasmid) [Pusillimonas sp. T7-7]|uniref:hypothetical protein n=1 Tax=Pusillimonas sp. (strain T7-7) TaxID=1007105 RepID=UPI0002084A7F|nr:hypothetical protein [Pusillimonas sp. T7-7]AEC22244.1 hypothetical protein PT7_P008 [Pusillimonas sp. T7-7]
MTTDTVLTDERITEFHYYDYPTEAKYVRAIEQAVLQSIANDPNRINAAAKALSRHMDYPWEFMTVEGRDNMRKAAMITINAAMEKQT